VPITLKFARYPQNLVLEIEVGVVAELGERYLIGIEVKLTKWWQNDPNIANPILILLLSDLTSICKSWLIIG
jgi:hypothetical protein